MTDARLDTAITTDIKASGIEGLRMTPRLIASWYGIPAEQARRAVRRLARRGLLKGGRVTFLGLRRLNREGVTR